MTTLPRLSGALPPSQSTTTPAQRLIERINAELRGTYGALSDDELLAELEAQDAQQIALEDEYAAFPAAAVMWAARRHAAQREWQRRCARYHAGQIRRGTLTGAPRIDWPELARQIREQHDGLVDLLTSRSAGTHLEHVGYSTRSGDEWAGPCPVCPGGGHDRFRVWNGPPGHYWCRRCGVSGSIIDAWQLLNPGGSFFDACRALAAELGLALPGAAPSPAHATAAALTKCAPSSGRRAVRRLAPVSVRTTIMTRAAPDA